MISLHFPCPHAVQLLRPAACFQTLLRDQRPAAAPADRRGPRCASDPSPWPRIPTRWSRGPPQKPSEKIGKIEGLNHEKMVMVMFDSLKLVKIPSLTRVCGRSV